MIPNPPLPRSRWRQAVCCVVASTALIAVAACSKSDKSPTEPATPAGILGRITSVVPTGNYRGYVRVEYNPTSASDGPKAIVAVTNSTTILLVSRAEGEFRNLIVGMWVRVWFDGPVAESYPVQGTAGTIAIDSTGSSVLNRVP